ncbi:sulfotransferase family protein [Marinimicrobium sp. C2-29]|uniref:sulfotransferase family protein n=1 Tax=Marinimicrobium sp. C2-29 TaxID=3139825 RepID=UPI003139905A
MTNNTANSLENLKGYPFIFIVGAPRSGTTLLSSMLNSHSEIAIPYESNFMVHCYNKYGLTPNLTNDSDLENLIDEILSGYFVSKWEPPVRKEDLDLDKCRDLPGLINEIYRCYAKKKGKPIYGDKTPGYTPDIHVLNRIFPNAKYIHIIRDGRDVALSLLDRSWGPSNFPIAMQFWKEMATLCKVQLAMLPPDRYLELRFEDLVREPEENLRKICSLLKIDFQNEMVSSYSNEWDSLPDAVKRIHANLQQGPSENQCYKWKSVLDGPDQAIAYEISGDLLNQHGYDVSVKHHKLKLLKKLYYRVQESVAWRLKKK